MKCFVKYRGVGGADCGEQHLADGRRAGVARRHLLLLRAGDGPAVRHQVAAAGRRRAAAAHRHAAAVAQQHAPLSFVTPLCRFAGSTRCFSLFDQLLFVNQLLLIFSEYVENFD